MTGPAATPAPTDSPPEEPAASGPVPSQVPSQIPSQAGTTQRPEEFTVHLDEVFQGPLDLLLHLVKEQEVEIQEIKLADIAHSYMDHVRALTDLDIEVAGDYLVMAATLMAIKSRSLLPREEVELEDDLDPHDELIQRLIEYRRFKGASDDLEDRLLRRSLEFPRGYRGEVRDNEPEKTFELGEITAWDLLATFSRLMRETLSGRTHRIKGDPRPLRWYVQTIGLAVRRHTSGATLRALVESLGDVPTREGLVGAFCALLELMKIGLVSAKQDRQEDDILLHWAAAPDQEGDLDDLIRASRFMDEDSEEMDESLDPSQSEEEAVSKISAEEPLDDDPLEAGSLEAPDEEEKPEGPEVVLNA